MLTGRVSTPPAGSKGRSNLPLIPPSFLINSPLPQKFNKMLPTTSEPSRKPSTYASGLTDSLAMSNLLKDREIGDILGKLEAAALEAIADENYQGAVAALKQSEEILEQMSTQGKAPDRDMVICMLNNTACCYQKYVSTQTRRTGKVCSVP